MRIAFFIDMLKENTDGVTHTSYHIIERLSDFNIEPLFITCIPPLSTSFKYKVITNPYLRMPYAKDYPFAIHGRKAFIFRELDSFRPHLIHWSSPSLLGRYATEYSNKRDIPNITIYHSHFSSYVNYVSWLPYRKQIIRYLDRVAVKLYTKADKVLPPTLSMKDYLVERGLNESKIKIWGRGIDTEKFNPNHRSQPLIESWDGNKKLKVLFVSRLVHYKETNMLIRVSKLLRNNVLLVITGEGPERDKMEKNCNANNTIFTGKLTGKALSEAYASSDLFVFPSLTDTFGNVVLEAMASGLPVLAANEGGPKNIIKHNMTGFLLEPKNEYAFNEKINFLMDNTAKFEEMKKEALTYAQSVSWDMIIKQLYKHYTDCSA